MLRKKAGPKWRLPRLAAQWSRLLLGLLLIGLAIALMVRGEVGLGPWDAFHVGISGLTGISVGQVTIGVGLMILVATWFIGVRPGPGTVANMILIGVFIDLFLNFVPEAEGWRPGLGYHLGGILLMGGGTAMYLSADAGAGPRDGMLLAVARLGGFSIRRTSAAIEMTVLLSGWAMGATVGWGTILYALLIGPTLEWWFTAFGVEKSRQRSGHRASADSGDPVGRRNFFHRRWVSELQVSRAFCVWRKR